MSNLTNYPKQSFFKTTLASPIDASQTSGIVLSAVPDYSPAGETIYISITDPDNPETISCTGWNTTTKILSGVTRGVANYSGGSSSASAHAAGTSVVLSDNWNYWEDLKTAINSKVEDSGDTMTGPLGFSGTTNRGITVNSLTTSQRDALSSPPDGTIIYNTTVGEFQMRQGGGWVTTSSGSVQPNGSETVAGKWEGATVAQQGTATDVGETGASLIPMNKNLVKTSSGAGDENKIAVLSAGGVFANGFLNATATPTASKIPIANGSGKLDNGWLNAKFGGDGSDGVLNVTSGTTTIDLANSAYVVKNYTSINVSAGATLTFSNPHTAGSIIVLKSQGNVTIAGTVNASGMGAAGGAGGALRTSSANFGIQGTNGTNAGFVLDISADHHGVKGGTTDTNATGGSGGAILTLKPFYTKEAARISRKAIYIAPGSGGGGGQGGSVSDGDATAGGTGGNGGGALLIEVGGSLDFSGTINVNGQNGTSAANASFTGANGEVAGGGGGGGGGAGMAVVLYNSLTANTGTITSAGGTGGNGGNATSTQVANGVCVSGAGGGGGGSYGGAGGTGGNGKTGTGGANGNNGNAGSANAGGGGGGGALIENPNGGTTYTGGVGGAAGASDGGVVAKNTEWF